MGLFIGAVKKRLENAGYLVKRIGRGQIIPTHIAEPELYARPEDYGRLLKPWRGREFDSVFTAEVVNNTMLSRMKLYYLYKFLEQTMHLGGDIFEAGTGSGGSSRLMLNRLRAAGARKSMWLLDTFEGYQKVDAARDGSHVQINQCKCETKEYVERLLANDAIPIHVVKGLIPGTLAEVKTTNISFAHIDVNLHEPTYEATRFCLERMQPGGMILFDDYGWPATYGARQAIDAVCAKYGQQVIGLSEQAFLIRR